MIGAVKRCVFLLGGVRGFMTVPGLISLGGVLLAIAMLLLDRTISQHGGLPYPELTAIPIGNARPILTTVAASSMAALSLVYSSVLVVFTLAAGNIGPRLLLRFARDRTNQIAVGTLGGTFLYSLIILRNQYDDIPVDISVNVALLLAALCVIMLLFFVNTAAKRVTIDEEVANIGNALDDELAKAIAANTPLDRENIVRPLGKEFTVASKGDGYINRIAFAEIARLASKNDAYVDFDVIPGDYVIKGQKLATIFAAEPAAMAAHLFRNMSLGRARTSDADLAFSVNLLVEIALRALSPGTNDTFTAIACVDRLSASLAHVRRTGLSTTVYNGPDGAARVTAPGLSVNELIETAFDPLRRAARGNLHIVMALGRIGMGEYRQGEDAIRQQLELVRAGIHESDTLDADKATIDRLIDETLRTNVGQPLPIVSQNG